MAAPPSTVAPWSTIDELPCTADPDRMATALQVATDVLFQLSGRQFPGATDVTIRPTVSAPSALMYGIEDQRAGLFGRTIYGWTVLGVLLGTGQWCGCVGGFGLTGLKRIYLGLSPIRAVDTVKIDGAVVAPSAYRVDDYRYLTRIDGGLWPCCQDLSLPNDAPGTFSVSFSYGSDPPPSGVLAAQVLACELVRAMAGDDKCRLPRRVTSVVSQGLSVQVDPMQFLTDGRVGLYEVDLFLETVNPNRLRARGRVYSPDTR